MRKQKKMSYSLCFRESCCLHFHDQGAQAIFLDYLNVHIKTLWPFTMSETTQQWHSITLQKTWMF